MAEMASNPNNNAPGSYLHNPKIFEILKTLFEDVAEGALLDRDTEEWLDSLPDPLPAFMEENAFSKAWLKIKNNTPSKPEKVAEAFHTWFDAFRTLKFVHFCETRYPKRFPMTPSELALPKREQVNNLHPH